MPDPRKYSLTADQEILMLLAIGASDEMKQHIHRICSSRKKAGTASQLSLALVDLLEPIKSAPDPIPTVDTTGAG